jgi:two-component system, chemotaxis family, CheB/CheR fusion protein
VIRSFTPAVAKIFNILPGDRGRPITDLSSRFSLPALSEDIDAVFAGHGPIERRVGQDDNRAHYLVRLGPYRNGEHATAGVVLTFTDVTTLTQAKMRQDVLIAELQHRTRNLLAVIQSIAAQTLPRDTALQSFITRLGALARVQSLVSEATDDMVDLAGILRLELQAHGATESDHVVLAGPSIALSLDQVQTFALALHELATNAVKHGALKDKSGHLAVVWSVDNGLDTQPGLILDWRETGVSMPADISRHGFGRKLIEQALAFSLRARGHLTFGEDGVACRIEMPLAPQPHISRSQQVGGLCHGGDGITLGSPDPHRRG